MEQQHSGDDTSPTGFGPSGFGRGWIPAERDIGLPFDELRVSGDEAFGPSPVAPAEAGAYPVYPAYGEPGVFGDGSDGPLPSQGRRGGVGEVVRHDGFTPERKARFLHHLSEQGNVRLACAAVGVSAQAAYVARRRERAFAAGWAAALVLAREAAEQVLADRALNGVAEPIFYRGEQVGARVRFDGRLLLAHLARLDRMAEGERGGQTPIGADAERFDELLALVAGEAPPEDMGADRGAGSGGVSVDGGSGLPPPRAAYVARAVDAAERRFYARLDDEAEEGDDEVIWAEDIADDGAGEDAGDWDEDEDEAGLSYDERYNRAVTTARAEAAARWDAWQARAFALGDAALGDAAEFLPLGGGGPA